MSVTSDQVQAALISALTTYVEPPVVNSPAPSVDFQGPGPADVYVHGHFDLGILSTLVANLLNA